MIKLIATIIRHPLVFLEVLWERGQGKATLDYERELAELEALEEVLYPKCPDKVEPAGETQASQPQRKESANAGSYVD
jgi:hypothetical protein